MSVFKIRKPGKPGEFSTCYYMKIRVGGKQILRSTQCTDKAAALKIEAAAVRKGRADGAAAMLEALEPTKLRRTIATLGDIGMAWLDGGVQVVRDAKAARRMLADLRRVVAFGRDLWTVAGTGLPGVAPGTRIPDVARIDALPASVLTRELVRAYFRARQGGEVLDVNARAAGNRAINSTLGHARGIFSRRALAYKLGKLSLPDLKGFMEEPELPEPDPEPDPLSAEEFAQMVAAAASELSGDLALVNALLRSTGMRSKELTWARGSWLVEESGRLWIAIRDREEEGWRQKGVRARQIPVPQALEAVLRSRRPEDHLILPGATKTAREDLVSREHNAWLKRFIGGLGTREQGNHRLRDTVCSALWTLHGPAAAQEAAGHVDPKTTSKHYARRMPEVPEVLRQELAAWGR